MNSQHTKTNTLCIIHEHPRVLLAMKKRGFGAGRWNGFGGKLEEGETIEEGAKREVFEESTLAVEKMTKMGIVTFEFVDDPMRITVHIFRGEKYSGKATETEEMRPEWFYVDSVPFKDMWPGDIHWLPYFFQNAKFKGVFTFKDQDTLIDHKIDIVDEL